MSLLTPLITHAVERPDETALTFEETSLSWAALERASAHIASALQARRANGRLALLLPNGLGFVVLFTGAVRAGWECQILDPEWPQALQDEMISRLQPDLLVSADAAHAASPHHCRVAHDASVDDLLAQFEAPLAGDVKAGTSKSLFYTGFTSGSTGLPKGYSRDQNSWLKSFAAENDEFRIGPRDVILAAGTLTHSLFLYALIRGLHAGAHVLLARRFRPDVVATLLHQHRPSIVYGVPTQFILLMDHVKAGTTFPHVRLVLASGAKWAAQETSKLKSLFPNALFAEFYGASELSFVAVARDDEAVPEGSVGRPFEGVTVTIRDDNNRVLPPLTNGRVFVESPLVFRDYALPTESGCTRLGDAISVGDIGHLDESGFLFLEGREKRMIVTSGKNLFPEQVERVLEQHPDIRHAALIAVADAKRGERLVALVNGPVSRASLMAHARLHLVLAHVPRLYVQVKDWPLTPSGKTDFSVLAAGYTSGAYEDLP